MGSIWILVLVSRVSTVRTVLVLSVLYAKQNGGTQPEMFRKWVYIYTMYDGRPPHCVATHNHALKDTLAERSKALASGASS